MSRLIFVSLLAASLGLLGWRLLSSRPTPILSQPIEANPTPQTSAASGGAASELSDEAATGTRRATGDPTVELEPKAPSHWVSARLDFVDWSSRLPAFEGTRWSLTRGDESQELVVDASGSAPVMVTAGTWNIASVEAHLSPLLGEIEIQAAEERLLVMVVRQTPLIVHVRDGRRNPVVNATVRWWPPYSLGDQGVTPSKATRTNSDGTASLGLTPTPRAGTLRVTCDGYFPAEVSSAAACRNGAGNAAVEADVNLDAYDPKGAASIVLATAPEDGWVESSETVWDLHGFFDGDEHWGGPDTVLVGSAPIGEAVTVPETMLHARRWQLVFGTHEIDWLVDDNLPLEAGETRTIALPKLVNVTLAVEGLGTGAATGVVHASIPADEQRPSLTWSHWKADIDSATGRCELGVPEGAALEASVRTTEGRAGSKSLASARPGSVVEIALATTTETKELIIDAQHVELVRVEVHDRTNLRPRSKLRPGPDGLYRLQLPVETYSFDAFTARGLGLRIRLLDAKTLALPLLVLTERDLVDATLLLVDASGEVVVGEHVMLSPSQAMQEGAGPYVARETPDGAYRVRWHNRIHATSGADGRAHVLAPAGEYAVELESESALPSMVARGILQPPEGIVTISSGRDEAITVDARRTVTLSIHMPDHPLGQPRRFTVKGQRPYRNVQFSGDRAVVEVGTSACTLSVYAPGLDRDVSITVPAGFQALEMNVEF